MNRIGLKVDLLIISISTDKKVQDLFQRNLIFRIKNKNKNILKKLVSNGYLFYFNNTQKNTNRKIFNKKIKVK